MTQVPANKPERSRLREPRDEREPGTGAVVAWEHGRLFAQLFGNDGEGSGYGSSLAGTPASTQIAMIHAMTEQLVPRIHAATQWPLQAVLYLPKLGRINASVRREQGAWNIELEAEEESTTRWLLGVRQRFQDGMAAALGQPVNVHLVEVGPA